MSPASAQPKSARDASLELCGVDCSYGVTGTTAASSGPMSDSGRDSN